MLLYHVPQYMLMMFQYSSLFAKYIKKSKYNFADQNSLVYVIGFAHKVYCTVLYK